MSPRNVVSRCKACAGGNAVPRCHRAVEPSVGSSWWGSSSVASVVISGFGGATTVAVGEAVQRPAGATALFWRGRPRHLRRGPRAGPAAVRLPALRRPPPGGGPRAVHAREGAPAVAAGRRDGAPRGVRPAGPRPRAPRLVAASRQP